MNNDRALEELLQHLEFPLTFGNSQRIKDLRILLEATQVGLMHLEKDPTGKEDLILQERVILSATREEIERLKRKALH